MKKEFGRSLPHFRNRLVPNEAQKSLGVDVAKDIDWIQVISVAGDTDHPLLLASGEFDVAKFKPAPPHGLRQVNKPGDRYRLYELPVATWPRPLTLAPGDHLVLMCDKPSRVTDVLADVAANKMPALDDALLDELLKTKVKRDEQTIWGAASLKKLEPIALDLGMKEAAPAIRAILKNARAVYGGISCGDDKVHGTIYFLADSEKEALEVEQNLGRLCFLAKTAAVFPSLANIPPETMPLVKFLATGEVKRDGKTVTLNCQLPQK